MKTDRDEDEGQNSRSPCTADASLICGTRTNGGQSNAMGSSCTADASLSGQKPCTHILIIARAVVSLICTRSRWSKQCDQVLDVLVLLACSMEVVYYADRW
jgi:hypothetical protein